MAAISIRNVVKRYGHGPKANQVIHGVNAEIADGEFIVIVGPSGCGKSTLLRMVAGLEEISEGEIAIGNRVVNDIEPAERDIAMVFQNYALYPHMSVFDNMAYGLKIAKVPRAEIEARVQKAAKILEIGPFLARKPRELSGGQRQRVAMGRAIVRQPQVFLFDEPLSNLDAKLRAQTRLEIQKLHAELGVTSLFVTHDQVEAMTLAQRMIVMNAGAWSRSARPRRCTHSRPPPSSPNFIGSPPMNLLAGMADGARFAVDGQSLSLPAPAPRNGPLILGCAPSIRAGPRAAGQLAAHGRRGRDARAPSGSSTAGSANRCSPCASTARCRRPGRAISCRCKWAPDRLHWFDPQSRVACQLDLSRNERHRCSRGPIRCGSRTAAPAARAREHAGGFPRSVQATAIARSNATSS